MGMEIASKCPGASDNPRAGSRWSSWLVHKVCRSSARDCLLLFQVLRLVLRFIEERACDMYLPKVPTGTGAQVIT